MAWVVRQLQYDRSARTRRSKTLVIFFDVSVIRACKQLQHEAEEVLYGTSSWQLMYADWGDMGSKNH
ncbi:hypothetical protein HO173_005085 [Letharia columbiana]|uniref:Uncharacterized protein n=1 Tax=Letharia columbiana TaxID=112416 RepID=A0A8H6FXQ3_9LECA|nr:uncharacterized protein HO173_005085 [Letharia columbiana]KAF6236794.1 hypothetical protein HO173_005085 [Letharia columbiana]